MKTSRILAFALLLFTGCLEAADDPTTQDETTELRRGPRDRGDDRSCRIRTQCVFGKHWDQASCACVPDETPPVIECLGETPCDDGTHWDDAACACVEDAQTPPELDIEL